MYCIKRQLESFELRHIASIEQIAYAKRSQKTGFVRANVRTLPTTVFKIYGVVFTRPSLEQ